MKRTTDAFVAGELREGDDLVFVEAAQDDRVDLHGFEAGAFGGADAGDNRVVAIRDAGDAGEFVAVDRVHADGDAGEPGVFEWLGEVGEQMAIRGDGDIWALAGGGGHGGDIR